jgi:hypothetical protein
MSEQGKKQGESFGAEAGGTSKGAGGGGKFILLYVNNEDSKDMMKHILTDTDNERGVFLKSDLTKQIVAQFDYLKDRGYFPTAMILSRVDDIVEFTFRRHPQQQPSQKLTEFVGEDKFKL